MIKKAVSWWTSVVDELRPGNQFLRINLHPRPNLQFISSGQRLSEVVGFNLTILRLKKEDDRGNFLRAEDIRETIIQTTINKTLECSYNDCQEIRAVRFRITKPGDYFIRLDFNKSEVSRVASIIEVTGVTMSFANAVGGGIVKIIMFLYAVIDFVMLVFNFHRKRKELQTRERILSFEQRYMLLLSFSMIMFFDPIAIWHAFAPTPFT